MVVALANSLGPVLGGIFTEKLNWRWCFVSSHATLLTAVHQPPVIRHCHCGHFLPPPLEKGPRIMAGKAEKARLLRIDTHACVGGSGVIGIVVERGEILVVVGRGHCAAGDRYRPTGRVHLRRSQSGATATDTDVHLQEWDRRGVNGYYVWQWCRILLLAILSSAVLSDRARPEPTRQWCEHAPIGVCAGVLLFLVSCLTFYTDSAPDFSCPKRATTSGTSWRDSRYGQWAWA